MATKQDTNGKKPNDPTIRPVQVTLQIVFAPVGDDGVGDAIPGSLTISGRVWERDWATPTSRRLFAQTVAQLQEQLEASTLSS